MHPAQPPREWLLNSSLFELVTSRSRCAKVNRATPTKRRVDHAHWSRRPKPPDPSHSRSSGLRSWALSCSSDSDEAIKVAHDHDAAVLKRLAMVLRNLKSTSCSQAPMAPAATEIRLRHYCK